MTSSLNGIVMVEWVVVDSAHRYIDPPEGTVLRGVLLTHVPCPEDFVILANREWRVTRRVWSYEKDGQHHCAVEITRTG